MTLRPRTLASVFARMARMPADAKAQLSAAWLAQLQSPHVDVWTLGFDMVDEPGGAVVGECGFKGPPDGDATVEIAYAVKAPHQGRGYATDAARALVAYAFGSGRVRVVRAHTLPAPNASTRVLTKCGFHHLGEVMDPEDGLVWRWECGSVST